MPFIGNQPAKVPLTSADITDGIITNADISSTAGITLNKLSGNPNFRNRIINGDMRIDQRNAGAALTVNSTANTYMLDRWFGNAQVSDGVFTVQQDTVAPTGFTNSAKITVTTADASIGATQFYLFRQAIEGNNVADLGFGTANAKTVTLSFWVRSSVTGTFSGVLQNADNTRNYPFTYTINSANTFEQKTITVAGDTTGTWGTGTGRGITVTFSLGAGTSSSATAGAWTGTSSIFAATGATNLIATLNATWYITGVQLEAGTNATDFEFLPIDVSLARCQRYFYKRLGQFAVYLDQYAASGTFPVWNGTHPVEMRSSPTGSIVGTFTSANAASLIINSTTELSINIAVTAGASTGRTFFYSDSGSGYFANSEL